jgi:5-methyltetrahydropteroyltriglutamate--homocysteine methyltransferase
MPRIETMTKRVTIAIRPLATMGVGSYATPGWMFAFRSAMRDGRAGAEDIEEAFDDATRVVVADQIEAGVDILSDGELRRQRFVYEMYDRLTGIERVPAGRRLGVPGYDMAPSFVANERITAPNGLGLVEEYLALRRIAPDHRLKMAMPGPLTFANNICPVPAYGERADGIDSLLADLTAIIGAELSALNEAGADFIQLDEPGFANPPNGLSMAAGAVAINQTLAHAEGITAVHVCFGNNASRPFVRRDFARLMPAMGDLKCDLLLLEFANREMADLTFLPVLAEDHAIAAGVIDVKSFHVETADEVAARIRAVLEVVPAEKLFVTADCGFSAIPRWLARVKLKAMVAGADIVRRELGHSG